MLSFPSASFRAHYQALASSGAIEPDPAQEEVAQAFSDLEERLSSYKPLRRQGLFGRLFADKDEPPPRGLYVHGDVGRGKTMLMDLFFQQSQVEHKRRAHFYEFMADVHERIYGYRQGIARGEIADGDVIALTAAHLREQSDNLTAQATRSWHTWPKSGCQSLGAEAAFEGGLPFGLLRFPCQAGLAACVSLPRHIAAQFA